MTHEQIMRKIVLPQAARIVLPPMGNQMISMLKSSALVSVIAVQELLLVANHISWLDILVLHAAGFCRFVSKADIKDWPVIGMMATHAGTLTAQISRTDTFTSTCDPFQNTWT